MKTSKMPLAKLLKNCSVWSTDILTEAIKAKNTPLIANVYILSELCNFYQLNTNKNYIIADVSNLLKEKPSLFFEFLCLEKKYQAENYQEQYGDLVAIYQDLLKEIYMENSRLDTFKLISLISSLQENENPLTHKDIISLKHEMILHQPKEAITTVINTIFFQTNFGLEITTPVDKKCIAAIEAAMLDAIMKYDLLFASQLLRTLAYVKAPKSYTIDTVVSFLLKNQSIEGNIGHYEVELAKSDPEDKMFQKVSLSKEIIIALLEWETDFRFYRNFCKVKS